MLDFRRSEIVIVDGLKDFLSTDARPCEVVRQNQVAKIPPYPYVSYTVTTPIHETKGTYSKANDGTLYRSALQTWSFTVQSDDQDEAMNLAIKMHAYFSAVCHTLFADNGITVRRVRDISTRDNLLTIQYEYRKGLDVMFGLLYSIAPDEQIDFGVIEINTFKEV